MIHLKRGILIAIEGIDGSGKSTLAQEIFTSLQEQGFDLILTKEPGDSDLGKHIRELVQTQNVSISAKSQYLLFAADRAQHFTEKVIPALYAHKIVLSDRLADSSLAYQGYGNGLDIETLKTINTWSMNEIPVDLTLFIKVPVELALERCAKRGSLSAYERKEFLQKVADGFDQLYKNHSNSIIIDGTQKIECITFLLSKAIKQWILEKNLIL